MSSFPNTSSAPSVPKPGDVQVTRFDLNGQTVLDPLNGISGFEFSIREDILSPFLTGSVLFTDTQDSFRNYKMTGNDQLDVEWISNQKIFPKKSAFSGIIRGYSDYSILREGQHVYRGNFCSADAWNDSVNRISRSFTGTPSIIAGQVFDQELQSPYSLTVEETQPGQIHNFISPYWTASEILGYMAGHSVGKSGSVGYRFFQTINDGYFFCSPKYLKDKNRTHTVKRIKYSLNNIVMPGKTSIYDNYVADLEIAENIGILQLLPSLDAMESGMFGVQLNTYDITRKKFESRDITNYKQVMGDNTQGFINADQGELNDPTQMLQPRFLLGQQFLNSAYDTKDAAFRWADQSRYQREISDQHFKSVRLQAVIYGSSDMTVGDVLEFYMPVPNNQGQAASNSQFHQYISGKWIVTSCSHVFRGSRFYTNNITMMKDAW